MLGIAVVITAAFGLFASRHAVDAMYAVAPLQTAVAIACYVVLTAIITAATVPTYRLSTVTEKPWVDARCRVDLDD